MSNDWNKILQYVGVTMQLGFTLGSTIVIFFLIGFFLDNKVGGKGLVLFVFIILGVISGFYQAYKLIGKITTEDDHKNH